MYKTILLILFLPLFSFIGSILFGRFIGILGVSYLAITLIFFSFILSFIFFINFIKTGSVVTLSLSNWFFLDSINIEWSFYFDSLTVIMLVVVTFISFIVHLYSSEYMANDPHLVRFMSYLSLFTFCMLILITAGNFLQMFVGWEGVGLSSYLLINFWFTRLQANKSAIKAMLVNRIGDFFILLSLFTICFSFNSFDYNIIFNLSSLVSSYYIVFLNFKIPILDLICLLLFFGAMGKSAQVGLHTWLPDAMEGPTPVSALIHAATMVTAGVFLIIRCSYLFELSPFVLQIVILVGCLTAFFASTTSLFQNDIKKIIAYSTCSQLGYMVFACGLSAYDVAIFHLFNHAFFKALLFLGAGSIIHAAYDEQDMRFLGGFKNLLPFSYAITVIGSLALIGFPFLSGFYSKDTILEVAYIKYNFYSQFSYTLGVITAFFTACYSTRLVFLVFLSQSNINRITLSKAHEGSWPLFISLFLLCILSLFVGFLAKDMMIGLGVNFWATGIFVLPHNYALSDVEFINSNIKLLPLFIVLFGVFITSYLYIYKTTFYFLSRKLEYFIKIYTFFNKKWYFDRIYNEIIVINFLKYGYYLTYKSIDRGLLEKIGPHGISRVSKDIFNFIQFYQSGIIFHFLLMFLLSIFLFLYIIYL
jgi:proton-translocating NADH-quinone oxidoreductase chain L